MGLGDNSVICGERSNRRTALRLALGAALLPMAVRPAFAATTSSVDPIAPPTGPMIYRRTLERQLPGGALYVVSRDFAVRFERLVNGYRVSGRQAAVRVDAPASLGSFAELERQRVEQGIFPLLLDRAGLILDGAEAPPSEELANALADVRRRLGDQGEEASTLVEALHMTGSRLTAYLPRDLFSPAEGGRDQREQIDLPWGDAGEVVSRFTAQRDPHTRLMRFARRDVTTRIGADERNSGEQWELFSN